MLQRQLGGEQLFTGCTQYPVWCWERLRSRGGGGRMVGGGETRLVDAITHAAGCLMRERGCCKALLISLMTEHLSPGLEMTNRAKVPSKIQNGC